MIVKHLNESAKRIKAAMLIPRGAMLVTNLIKIGTVILESILEMVLNPSMYEVDNYECPKLFVK